MPTKNINYLPASFFNDRYQVQVEEGDIVLFPSWLEHFTEPSTFSGKRITISLNVMPKGITSPMGLIEHTY